jgi:hypothetical protein
MNPGLRSLMILSLLLGIGVGCKTTPPSTLRSQESMDSEKSEPKRESGKKASLILDLLKPTEEAP